MPFCSVRNRITFREDSSVGLRKLAPSGVHLECSHGVVFLSCFKPCNTMWGRLEAGALFLFLAFCGSLF